MVVSLQLENVIIELIGTESMIQNLEKQKKEARGAPPNFVECLVIIYIIGFIVAEIKSLWSDGLAEYVRDLWNIIDYIINFFFVNWMLLR